MGQSLVTTATSHILNSSNGGFIFFNLQISSVKGFIDR